MAAVASVNERYNKAIFPLLIEHLKRCPPKNVPQQHAESIFVAVNTGNKKGYMDVLDTRKDVSAPPQLKRIRRIFKLLENIK